MAKYHIHGLSVSSNTWKTVYVAEELGVDYQYTVVDFQTGAHKAPEHLARHPFGKLPTLTVGSDHIFESGAICRFMAANEKSPLYPDSPIKRAVIDQWMNFFTCHLGQSFNSYTFETVAKKKFGLGTPDQATIDSSLKSIQAQLPVVDTHLGKQTYMAGSALTIADLYCFAYSENAVAGGISLSDYPNFKKWFDKIKALPSIKRAHQKLGLG